MNWLPPRDQRLPELQAVLDAIGRELVEKPYTADNIVAVCHAIGESVVTGHVAEVCWYPFGYMNDDDDEPEDEELAILISGTRLQAGWIVRLADLEGVLREGRS